MGCDRNTNSSLDAPLGFRKKDGTTPFHPIRSVVLFGLLSSCSSFFRLLFRFGVSYWCLLFYAECHGRRSRKFRDYETRVFQKKDPIACNISLSRYARDESFVVKFETFPINNTVLKVDCNGNKLMHL